MGKNYPKDAGYLLLIAEQFFKEGKFEVCLELMQAYCKGNPTDLNAQSNMGMVMEILGRNDEALALYEQILKQNPKQTHTLDLYTKLKAKIK
jgi:tetratricopeptide (TPR) repeat protein